MPTPNDVYLPYDAPPPDVSDLRRQHKEAVMDTLEIVFQMTSSVVLYAALMKPGETLNIGFDKSLQFLIVCDTPQNSVLALNPEWKQYTVNGEWVGNIHGMEKQVVKLCWDNFVSRLEEIL